MKFLTILLLLLSCSKKDDSSSDHKKSKKFKCPSTLAASSHLPVNPVAETAVPIHANGVNTSWRMQLMGTLNTSYDVDVYDVDLFDTSKTKIASIQASGAKVVCYFSAGSSEDWRPDYGDFEKADKGKPLDGWDGENWLDIRSMNVLNIMKKRLDLAVEKGCDGVDPDNMDGYTQDSCFDLKASDQLAYNRKIANLARARGLSVGLKNEPSQVEALEPYFDFSVTEQCYFYDECDQYFPMVDAGKPVFAIEYDHSYRSNPTRGEVCDYANDHDLQLMILGDVLDDSYLFECY